MANLKIFKVNALPNPTQPSTLYFITQANNKLGFHLTDKDNTVVYSSFNQTDVENIAMNLLGPKHLFMVGDVTSGEPAIQTGQIGTYTRQISTNGSAVTFYLTSDGTANGNALFSDLTKCDINIHVMLDTTSDNLSPWMHLRQLDVNNKFIVAQLKQSHTGSILIGGNYSGNNNNTSTVTLKLTVTGILA